MGNARWSAAAFTSYSASVASKPREEVFASRSMIDGLDPAKIKFRESVDSAANPASNPIIIACDETGSMGVLSETIIRKGLGIVMKSIYDHKPVSDPHICCMGTGDATCDSAPLQVTQFEASVDPLVKQVEQIWLEGNGGGNGGESYALAWWFATYKVKSDAFAKRGRKGYLFTIGDEAPLPTIGRGEIREFMGVGCEADIRIADLLQEASKYWHVYHLIVETNATKWQNAIAQWKGLLNERAIVVRNHDKLAEIIVTIITVNEGADANRVVADFDQDTQNVVLDATRKLLPAGV